MTMTRAQRLTLAAAIAAALSMAAPAAQAQRPGAGSVQLHLDAQLVDLQVFPDVLNQFSLGVAGIGLGPGVGYQLADGLIIGARTAFGFTLVDPVTPGDSVSGSLALLPYFEFLIGDGDIVPFVDIHAGFQAVFPEGRDAYASAIAGVRGGIHAFLTESFSLSPWAMINFLYNGGAERAGFELALGFSLVGWIGGEGAGVGPEPELAPAPAPAPAGEPAYDPAPPPPPPAGNPEQGLGNPEDGVY